MIGSRSLHGPGIRAIVPLALILGLSFAASAEAALTYTLSSELKKASCSGDTDSDCLDNLEEGNLAWAAAPWYFYDEDEGCSGWRNRFGLPSYHFARQDFFQVRPQGGGIRNWSPTDGQAKWVKLVYFFVFPHDCHGGVGTGLAGHQGDTEHIKIDLYSYDLKTWYLYNANYAHHWWNDNFSGAYLEERARALGTSWISVAADQDSHGSWPGWQPDSSNCAGSEDDLCGSTCDCFVGTWRNAFNTSAGREVVGASRNIGGPSPESWNTSVVTLDDSTEFLHAYTALDVGHGYNREYWSAKGGMFQKNCGWECPDAYRKSDGSCSISVHGESGCSSPLSEKVEANIFSLGGGSCAGSCGGSAGSCFCDPSCVTYGDCCPDACAACGAC